MRLNPGPLVVGLCLLASPAVVAQNETTAARAGSVEIAPRGYIQFDWRAFPDWPVTAGTGRLSHGTIDVRRLRGGLDGSWRRLSFEVTVDPQDEDGVFVKDAYGQLRLSSALRIRAGQFKVPGGRDYQTSARSVDFLERAAFAESIGAGRDLGAMIGGRLPADFDYDVGLLAGDGHGRQSRARATAAGRLAWDQVRNLELAATFSVGRTQSQETEEANGLLGRSSSGYRFFERVYVDGRRARIGADARWSPGAWRFTAEVLRASDERRAQGLDYEDLPAVIGLGWSAAARHEFGRRNGSERSRLREWDIAFRYDSLSFDDSGPATGTDSVRPRATDIRPRAAGTLTLGASWSPLRWTRIMTNGAIERYSDRRSAPDASRKGLYWTVGTRLQLELP